MQTRLYFFFVFQHGLWLDCTRADRAYISSKHISDHPPLHCTYKLDSNAAQILEQNAQDVDGNSAAAESEHHHFFGASKFFILALVQKYAHICIYNLCSFKVGIKRSSSSSLFRFAPARFRFWSAFVRRARRRIRLFMRFSRLQHVSAMKCARLRC